VSQAPGENSPNSSYDEVDPPDPQPETTPGLAPGGSVQPGDTPPIESSTSATNYRQPDLPSSTTNWLVLGGIALAIVLVALLLLVRTL
jgi:hypothetical protein